MPEAGPTCRRDEPAIPAGPGPAAGPLPDALNWIAGEIDALRAAGLERPHRVRSGRQGRMVTLDGRTLLNFGSNDYLGYAADVRLAKAAAKASCAEGFGAGASPLVSGHSRAHEDLERRIAALLDVGAALVFPSGFAANAATLAALAGPDDFIASDARNHASIIDGCRLARAKVGIYPHRDMAALDRLLAAATGARRRIVVSDTLFSMDGSRAPLADLCGLARRHAAILVVDEAHATGLFGAGGSGLVEEAGCADGVHVRIGTLSKAIGAAGGFVAGHPDLVHWLRHAARAWIFSTAHPPAVAAAAARGLALVTAEPDRRRELAARAADFRGLLAATGLDTGTAEAQIVPVIVGAADAAVAVATALAAEGFFAPAIRPPSVPTGLSLVRASVCWHHTAEDLTRLAAALARHAGR
ncbi:MAG: aminotransferase class I/II-fold pyridoxal phosphate-dependent enzyme [Planctomycetia bacterium]|jgi:8-amino-7-oxononanoate synthase